ncbi:uncharacterized protein RJT20DRAFT_7543 [Scheffersomyces xylosifermentans]|uniref:uncharacterized protein n=1 Tax=Scheffersomyces xylosifermentans TaxID=1304137 RepID=UPI00315CC8AD
MSNKFLSQQDTLTALTKLNDPADTGANISVYYYISISLSCFLSVFYFYRYKRITKKLPIIPQSTSKEFPDIRFCVVSLIVLTVWNLLFTLFNQHIVLDLPTLTQYLERNGDFNLINETKNSSLNWFYFVKDMEITVIMVISMLLIHLFSIGILRCSEYFQLLSSYIQKDQEARFGKEEGGIPTFNYGHHNNSVEQLLMATPSPQTRVSLLPQFYHKKFFKKHIAIFFIVLVASTVLLPSTFQLTSSSIIYELNTFQFKFDHIFVALVVTFTIDTFTKFVKVIIFANNHLASCNKFTGLITRFIWLYDCIILNFSLGFIIIFNDVLINMINLIINDGPQTTTSPVHSKPISPPKSSIQFISSILINYLSHSGLAATSTSAAGSCSDSISYSYCVQQRMLLSLIQAFDSLYDTLINCWNVLNLFCFIIAPLTIWLFFEIKIEMLSRRNYFNQDK